MSNQSRRKWEGERIVIFVEGYSDLHFYAELLESAGFKNPDYFIQQMNCKS